MNDRVADKLSTDFNRHLWAYIGTHLELHGHVNVQDAVSDALKYAAEKLRGTK